MHPLTLIGKHTEYLDELATGYISDILKHVDHKRQCLRENVRKNGIFDDETSDGRMLNPGHAIEASWFLREYLRKYGDSKMEFDGMDIEEITRNIFEWSFATGWDTENGGLYAFCDAVNGPQTMLESKMKLWWPVNEAMICSLLLLRDSIMTGRGELKSGERIEKDWERVRMICDYGLKAFSDGQRSGWYGYLRSDSKIELTIKGGPYKGFFHVPRSLLFSVNILDEMIQRMASKL